MSIENVFRMRNGDLKQAINTTLDICDKYFDELDVDEKLCRLEYCLLWSMIGMKA